MSTTKERAFVKLGSESLTDKDGFLSLPRVARHAENIMRLKRTYRQKLKVDLEVDIVSSGAVAAGREYYEQMLERDSTRISQHELAAIGNPIMAGAWRTAFRPFGLATGLVLVTNHEILDKKEGLAIQKTDAKFKAGRTIAIYNANDAIEHDELDKLEYGGDNDWLAARLAVKLGATAILFATNEDGFKTSNGQVQRCVKGSSIEGLSEHFFENSNKGAGGIKSKLEAAHFAAQAGVEAYIGNSNADYAQIMAGQIGTRVLQ